MLVNQSAKMNKENLNPVLIVNQQEQLKQNGILPKSQFNKGSANRHQNTFSCYQQHLTKCTSSRSLQEQIERIAKKLKLKQIKEKETSQQCFEIQKCSIDEMVDMLQNDKLLHIRSLQLQPSSNKNRPKSPKNMFPPLQLKQNFQSFETTKSSETETISHKLELKSSYQYKSKPQAFQKTESREIIKQKDDSRKKRTVSQVIEPSNQNLTKKERIQRALQNTERIFQLCTQMKKNAKSEIIEQISEIELRDLIKTEQFKIEFECLINFGDNSCDCRQQLQEFMTNQIQKYKELKLVEIYHQQKKQEFGCVLDECINKLKNRNC